MIKKLISRVALKIIGPPKPRATPIPFELEKPAIEELEVAGEPITLSYLGKPLADVPYRKPYKPES